MSKKRNIGHRQQSATIDVPELMHAAVIDAFGGPEMLTLQQVPVPKAEKSEVLIALDTAGVGSWDAEMRAGWYPDGPPDFPWFWAPTDPAGS
jgi:NADPH2:quinone reductase